MRSTPRKTLKPAIPTEDYEQIRLAAWLTKQDIRFFAIPNGGRRTPREGLKFKRLGVKPGIPDICIPIPSGLKNGLFLELKRKSGGVISEVQQEWIQFLNSQGYAVYVAKGFEEAKEIVLHYLSLPR